MRHNVYVISCDDYTQAPAAIAALLDQMGGIGRFVSPGESILLKTNLLAAAKPEQAITVHPAVAAAVGKLVVEQGASALLADSPGGPYKESFLRNVYEKCGMAQAAAECGATLNYDVSTRQISFPQGRALKHMEVIAPVVECNGLINLCKLKTHLFMSMTGAVKNHFGLIPGLSKVGAHANQPDKTQFAHMLLDLAEFAKPRLSIMDAVLAMEGDGPGASGKPRQVGLLLAAENPLALDVVAAEIIGLPKESNPILKAAQERGLTPVCMDEIELIGADLAALRIPDYQFPTNVRSNIMDVLGPLAGLGSRLGRASMTQTPYVKKDVCIGCEICKNACPAQAISMENRRARIQSKKCIRCYCCHELCPQRAVGLKKGLLARLLG